jgi:aryl-alcohol dehydrogenase-like predicted oxidoreductase
VYGNGHSEQLVARLRRERPCEEIIVATKAGRRLPQQTVAGYSRANLTAFIDRSLRNLDTERLDLLQLHCPPSALYERPDVFGLLDDLVAQGNLRFYGVSVEQVNDAVRAADHPNVQSVQIIFNMFRRKPAEVFFPVARERRIGVLARVPLASGLLSGKLRRNSTFSEADHRNFNRHGEAFDRGETFSGVDYDTGLRAVEELRACLPDGSTMAQFALRWTLMFPEVSAAIPGARNAEQVEANVRASTLPELSPATMQAVERVYDTHIRALVHHLW